MRIYSNTFVDDSAKFFIFSDAGRNGRQRKAEEGIPTMVTIARGFLGNDSPRNRKGVEAIF